MSEEDRPGDLIDSEAPPGPDLTTFPKPRENQEPPPNIDNAEDVTEELLGFLRNPPTMLHRAHEQITMEGSHLARVASLSLRGFSGRTAVVDVLRPAKGDVPRLEVLECSAAWQRLNHDEHEALASDLITLRFTKLADSIKIPGLGQDQVDDLVSQLLELLPELAELPRMSPARAKEVLDRCWTPASVGSPHLVLRPMALVPGIECSVESLSLLYQLCVMLSQRYLVLLELSDIKSGKVELTYRYHHAVSQSPQRPDTWKSSRFKKAFYRSFINKYLRRYPNSCRIHVPLAKKAVHYSTEITAAPSFFFWRAGAVVDPAAGQPSEHLVPPKTARWSSTLHNGRCAAVFMRQGHAETSRIYVAAELAEDPNLSAGHNAVLTSFATMVFGMFALFSGLASSYNAAWGALVVAVLGLTIGLVRDPIDAPSLLKAPLQSIALRIVSAFLIAFYSGWLISRGSSFDHHGFLSWMFDRWLQLGGLAITAVMLVWTIIAWSRFINVLRKYQYAVSGFGDRVHLYN